MNPHKLHALDYLLQTHRKDKVIVFSDNIFSLWKYAQLFKCLCISGKVRFVNVCRPGAYLTWHVQTGQVDREYALAEFRSDSVDTNVLFLSQVRLVFHCLSLMCGAESCDFVTPGGRFGH